MAIKDDGSAPELTVASIRAAGLFVHGGDAELSLPDGEAIHLSMLSADELEIRWTGQTRRQTVAITWVSTPFGRSPLLICPRSGKRCRSLFLDGEFVSRSEAGLKYATQSMTPMERLHHRAETLLSELEGQKGRPLRHGRRRDLVLLKLRELRAKLMMLGQTSLALERALENEAATGPSRRRRRRVRAADGPMSTRRALLEGRRADIRLPSGIVLRRLAQLKPPPTPPTRPTPATALLADQPELDIRQLRPRRGLARGIQLRWAPGAGREALWLIGALDETRRCLRLAQRDADEDVLLQEIQLVGGRREGDLFMLCPFTDARHVKLYYRDGVFASRQAHRLVHASQVSPRQALALLRRYD